MSAAPRRFGGRARWIAISALVGLAVIVTACGNEIVKEGGKKRLSASTTTLPAFAGEAPRAAVNCASEYFDKRQLSSSEPLDLPVQFPGAPDGSELCGVDTRTGVVAYTVPIAANAVAFYYASSLNAAGCKVAADTAAATTSNDVALRWTCGNDSGRVVVAADVGAFDIVPDRKS